MAQTRLSREEALPNPRKLNLCRAQDQNSGTSAEINVPPASLDSNLRALLGSVKFRTIETTLIKNVRGDVHSP